MSKMMRRFSAVAAAAAVAAAVAALGGCAKNDVKDVQVDQPSDIASHNRMMIHMAFAENVYNGTAAEKAIYSRDFHPGHATFNELGTRRMETLVDAMRGGKGRVVVIRGDASEELYAQRIDAVREQFIDAGFGAEDIAVARNIHVGGTPMSSERALLTFDRMMSTYQPKQQSGGGTVDSMTLQRSSGSSGSRNRGN